MLVLGVMLGSDACFVVVVVVGVDVATGLLVSVGGLVGSSGGQAVAGTVCVNSAGSSACSTSPREVYAPFGLSAGTGRELQGM